MKHNAEHRSTELALAGERVITSPEVAHVSASSWAIDPATQAYAIKGDYLLNRDTINAILRAPIGEPGDDWQEVQSGLKDLSYPSRLVKKIGRKAYWTTHLQSIRQPARELADILEQNTPQKVTTANIPVFKHGQSHRYVLDNLKTIDSRKLLTLMKAFNFDPRTARGISQLIGNWPAQDSTETSGQSGDIFTNHVLEQEIVNQVIVAESESRTLIELLYFLQEKWFVGFVEHPHYREGHMAGGAGEYSVYVRSQDVPLGVSLDDSEVHVGPRLRDDDKKSGLPRYKTHFIEENQAVFARPLLVWQKTPNGRSFVIPKQKFDEPLQFEKQNFKGPTSRLNALAGAAIAATVLGSYIDYPETLNTVLSDTLLDTDRVHRAGLWPLVLRHREDELLSSPYFQKIEQKFDGDVQ